MKYPISTLLLFFPYCKRKVHVSFVQECTRARKGISTSLSLSVIDKTIPSSLRTEIYSDEGHERTGLFH